ncbi:putative N6-adenine methyltransferase-domain-containing protein [Tricladium varicosporioides]|nr:putative N6-adenine methyltransferase-domain-containing protein [Hymenoscyphus varicosporioides]
MQKSCGTSTMNSLRTAARLKMGSVANAAPKRHISDITITRTGKPIIRTQGGRSSLGGHTVTVFGATGFLGRYIVNRLARQGCTVIVPYREEMAKRHLKVTGDLGRVIFMEFDLRNTPSIEESVRHSDVVYNLIGRNYPTKNFDLEDVHVEGVERIADAVAKYDVDRFIHVSSYNANPNSTSEFYRTKAQGEKVARSIFPETTIVRPAPLFGFEDRLLHKLAGVTNLFTSNHMQERYNPVHVIDVGMALEKMLQDDSTAEQTYELFGPKNYSTAEIAALVDKEIVKHRRHINVPKRILKPTAKLLNQALWWPVISADEVEREFIDQRIDKTAKTFKDLGIEPAEISSLTFHYLQGYRSSAFYDLPPATEREKREEKKALSSNALNALKDFYAERDARQRQFEDLKAVAEKQHDTTRSGEYKPLSMEAFAEDWNESQFWYSDETATALAEELLEGATSGMTIVVVSAPSVFVQVKNLLNERPKIYLLEFDKRFEVFPEFVFYDFRSPLKLPPALKGCADRVICDPPFLSEDCQTKAALTVRWLSRPWDANIESSYKLIVCTGERMEMLINKLYKPAGVATTNFEPVHSKGLSNEFFCYANFECSKWKWRE